MTGLLDHPWHGQLVLGSQLLAGALQSPISTTLPHPRSSASQNPLWAPQGAVRVHLKLGKGCPLACISDDSCQQQGCRDQGGGLPLPFILRLPRLCRLQRHLPWRPVTPVGLSSQPQSGSHRCVATWGVIALRYSNSSAGSELPWVSKQAVKPLAVVAWTRLLEVPSDDLGAERETFQPS